MKIRAAATAAVPNRGTTTRGTPFYARVRAAAVVAVVIVAFHVVGVSSSSALNNEEQEAVASSTTAAASSSTSSSSSSAAWLTRTAESFSGPAVSADGDDDDKKAKSENDDKDDEDPLATTTYQRLMLRAAPPPPPSSSSSSSSAMTTTPRGRPSDPEFRHPRGLSAAASTVCTTYNRTKIVAVYTVSQPYPNLGVAVDGNVSEWNLSSTGPDLVYLLFYNTFPRANVYLRWSCAQRTMCALVLAQGQTCVSNNSFSFWDYGISDTSPIKPSSLQNVIGTTGIANGQIIGMEACFDSSTYSPVDSCRTSGSAAAGVEFRATTGTCGTTLSNVATTRVPPSNIGLDLSCPCKTTLSVCTVPPPFPQTPPTNGTCFCNTCVPPCTTTIVCPPNQTVQCGNSTPAATGTATVSKTGTGCASLTEDISFSDVVSGSCQSRKISRTWAANQKFPCDTALTYTCVQELTFSDTQPPSLFNLPANETLECQDPAAATVTANDACQGSITPALTTTIVLGCGTGTTKNVTRTWTATDDCGNSVSASRYSWIRDTAKPTVRGVPDNSTASCAAVPAAPNNVTASDTCDPSATLTFTESNNTVTGECQAGKQIVRTWTAADTSGNTDSQSQYITLEDTVPPTFEGPLPENVTLSCDAPPPNVEQLSATDSCGNVTVRMLETSETGACPQNITYIRIWTAEDLCGNKATVAQAVAVYDTTNPTLSGVPVNTSASCDAIPDPPNVTASDSCDLFVVPNFTSTDDIVEGQCKAGKTITRTWTASDKCGNSASASQTITLTDTVAPTLSELPASGTVTCNAIPRAATVTGSDSCGGDVNVTMVETNTTTASCINNTIVRVWTGIDVCGNAASHTQVLSVIRDRTAPTLSCPANVTIACNDCTAATDSCLGLPTVADNCDGTPNVTYREVYSPATLPNFAASDVDQVLTRTYTARDNCNNAKTCTQRIVRSGVLSQVTVTRTVNGVADSSADATFELYQGPARRGYSGTKLATASSLGASGGVVLDVYLNPTKTYNLCLRTVNAGWTTTATANDVAMVPYNPNNSTRESLGVYCFDFQPTDCAAVFNIVVDNTFGGGCPRTSGYWRTWNNCAGSATAGVTAAANGGPANGYFVVEDLLPIAWEDANSDNTFFQVSDCPTAIQVLNVTTLVTCATNPNRRYTTDPVILLARSLLASQLNVKASSCVPPIVNSTIQDAEQLLDSLKYVGCKLSTALNATTTALLRSYAATLDSYSLGDMCPGCNS